MRCESYSASSYDSWNEFIYLNPSQLITCVRGSAARWAWRDSPAAAELSRNEAIDQKNESYSSEEIFYSNGHQLYCRAMKMVTSLLLHASKVVLLFSLNLKSFNKS